MRWVPGQKLGDWAYNFFVDESLIQGRANSNEILKTLDLLGTENCHLCDQAKDLLTDVLRNMPQDYVILETDISANDKLMERYGVRIPVVRLDESGRELGWPFDKQSLSDFLRSHSN